MVSPSPIYLTIPPTVATTFNCARIRFCTLLPNYKGVFSAVCVVCDNWHGHCREIDNAEVRTVISVAGVASRENHAN